MSYNKFMSYKKISRERYGAKKKFPPPNEVQSVASIMPNLDDGFVWRNPIDKRKTSKTVKLLPRLVQNHQPLMKMNEAERGVNGEINEFDDGFVWRNPIDKRKWSKTVKLLPRPVHNQQPLMKMSETERVNEEIKEIGSAALAIVNNSMVNVEINFQREISSLHRLYHRVHFKPLQDLRSTLLESISNPQQYRPTVENIEEKMQTTSMDMNTYNRLLKQCQHLVNACNAIDRSMEVDGNASQVPFSASNLAEEDLYQYCSSKTVEESGGHNLSHVSLSASTEPCNHPRESHQLCSNEITDDSVQFCQPALSGGCNYNRNIIHRPSIRGVRSDNELESHRGLKRAGGNEFAEIYPLKAACFMPFGQRGVRRSSSWLSLNENGALDVASMCAKVLPSRKRKPKKVALKAIRKDIMKKYKYRRNMKRKFLRRRRINRMKVAGKSCSVPPPPTKSKLVTRSFRDTTSSTTSRGSAPKNIASVQQNQHQQRLVKEQILQCRNRRLRMPHIKSNTKANTASKTTTNNPITSLKGSTTTSRCSVGGATSSGPISAMYHMVSMCKSENTYRIDSILPMVNIKTKRNNSKHEVDSSKIQLVKQARTPRRIKRSSTESSPSKMMCGDQQVETNTKKVALSRKRKQQTTDDSLPKKMCDGEGRMNVGENPEGRFVVWNKIRDWIRYTWNAI